jgi:hypothetical protein
MAISTGVIEREEVFASSETLEIMYDGPATESGGIESSVFLSAVAGIDGASTRAFQLLSSHPNVKLHVRVTGASQNCFIIVFLFYAAHVVAPLAGTAAHAAIAAALAAAPVVEAVKTVVSVVNLIHKLRGSKPKDVRTDPGGNFVVHHGEETYEVPPEIWRAYLDDALRAAAAKVVAPLTEVDGITKIELKPGESEPVVLEKHEIADPHQPPPSKGL